MDSRVRVLVFGLYVLLGVTGLSLWGLRHYDPLTDAWMAAKLLGLAFAVSAYRVGGRALPPPGPTGAGPRVAGLSDGGVADPRSPAGPDAIDGGPEAAG